MARRRRINEFFPSGEAREPAQRAPSPPPPEKPVDPELVAKIAAEKAVALLSRRILAELEECKTRLGEILARLEALEKAQPRGGGLREKTRRSRLEERVEEYLDKNRFLFLSEARQKLKASPLRVREAAENVGAVVIEAEGDIALMMPEHLEEFEALMKEARTADPEEAAERMGPYKRLFEKLRRSGLVYFDSARGYWRRL